MRVYCWCITPACCSERQLPYTWLDMPHIWLSIWKLQYYVADCNSCLAMHVYEKRRWNVTNQSLGKINFRFKTLMLLLRVHSMIFASGSGLFVHKGGWWLKSSNVYVLMSFKGAILPLNGACVKIPMHAFPFEEAYYMFKQMVILFLCIMVGISNPWVIGTFRFMATISPSLFNAWLHSK